MLSHTEIESLDQKLRVYDVVQGAWEQEPNGFEANARHVLTHLAKDLVGKDFTDVHLVRDAIAPDSLQYALRLSRWAGVSTADIGLVTDAEELTIDLAEKGLKKLPTGFAPFAGAVSILASNLHDLDHASVRETALANSTAAMRSASRLLINSALAQSQRYQFDLKEVFDTRLAELRKRFNVPEPA